MGSATAVEEPKLEDPETLEQRLELFEAKEAVQGPPAGLDKGSKTPLPRESPAVGQHALSLTISTDLNVTVGCKGFQTSVYHYLWPSSTI